MKKPVFDELTEPNLEMRIGALYALERVAKDSEMDRAQIFEIFSAYVSNNFDAPETFSHPALKRFGPDEQEPGINRRFWKESISSDTDQHELSIYMLSVGAPGGLGREWVKKLKRPRPDTRAAVSVIVRNVDRFGTDRNGGGAPALAFTGANLQRADFRGANLAGATFEACQLDGALFDRSDLSDAKFFACSLIGASFYGAKLSGARFARSRLECVNAGNIVSMSGCAFWHCDCSGSVFDTADLSNSSFRHVTARKAYFHAKEMNDTLFSRCDIRDGGLSAHSMRGLGIHETWVPETGV
ncbi:MAG: pentapeptide repeat-containing protein [Pseudomonadota bacterium]